MRECGCYSTTTLAQPRRPRHPYAVPRTLFECVCTRRRNCIGQLSPSSEYAPAARQINPNTSATTSALGRELHDIMERGELVSDDIVVEIVAERLQHNDVQDGYILDGFPRTVAQAVALDKVLGARNEKLDLVIELKVVPHDLIRRSERQR